MAQRWWVVPASFVVLALLVLATIGATVVSRRSVQGQLETTAERAAATVREEVRLNLQRDVAATAGLVNAFPEVTDVDAAAWSSGIEQIRRTGAYAEASGVNLLVATRTDQVDATLAELAGPVRDSLDLRLSRGPLHAIGVAVWPERLNRPVLGYDVLNNAEAAPAARTALRSKLVRASQPIRVLQEPGAQRSTVVYVPVVPGGGSAATGAVSLVFRAEVLLGDVTARLPAGTRVRWVDAAASLTDEDALLADIGADGVRGATAVEVLSDLGRTWHFEVSVPRTALGEVERRVPLLVAGTGALLSLGLLVTLAAWRGTTRRADQLTAERTAALAATTAQLEVTNRELQELDRFKDRLLGAVSHDMRSPLTVIQGTAELLHDRELPVERQRQLLVRLLRQAKRLRGLVEELLVSAQVRAGALQADRRPLDLRDLVATAVADLGVGEVGEVDPDLPPVLADRVHVERIVHNLLTNASAHGQPPVEVGLAVTAAGDAVELTVRDHGPGVPPELREAVFGEFTRPAGTTPGYGLGLAIVTELARANDGTLRYRESETPGACFVLTLPAADPVS